VADETVSSLNFQEILEGERDRLRQQLGELGHGGAGLDYDANFADTSQVTAERGEAETLAAELSDALADVDAALERLSAGTYGICDRCGQTISVSRLEAKPAARRCITCASKP
jgi:RNA polymerase-binding transcription factor DksA